MALDVDKCLLLKIYRNFKLIDKITKNFATPIFFIDAPLEILILPCTTPHKVVIA